MLQAVSPGASVSSSAVLELPTTAILLVGSAESAAELGTMSRRSGRALLVAETAAAAHARLADGEVDLIVVDLAAADGLKFLRRHAASREPAPIIGLADPRRSEASAEALRLGVVDIVSRPVRAEDVAAAAANATELARLARAAEPVTGGCAQAAGILAVSPAMRGALDIVPRVATSRCGVLIAGERGTGRETIARAIHAQGPRRDRPFVRIACADGRPAELERLLEGRLPAGCTVYLDGLEGLLPGAQAELEAALLQEQRTDHDAPRVIASALPANADTALPGAVRRQLLERLAVVRIDLPPLRARTADIPLLAMHFLKEACGRSGRPAQTFSGSALTLLAALPWHGNAVELRSLAERLAVLVPGGVVMLEHVLAHVRLDGAEAAGRPRESLRAARERFERDYIVAALRQHRGRMAEAAAELGIERTNLYRKIRHLNIRWALTG